VASKGSSKAAKTKPRAKPTVEATKTMRTNKI